MLKTKLTTALRRWAEKKALSLPCREIRQEDGTLYLRRYYLGKLFGQTFYLHNFIKSDPDRGVHDHPWRRSGSLILAGSYFEETVGNLWGNNPAESKAVRRKRNPLSLKFIKGTDFHRVILYPNQEKMTPWTIFFHGDYVKGWGFRRQLAQGHEFEVFQPKIGSSGGVDWFKNAADGRAVHGEKFTDKLAEKGGIPWKLKK